MKKKILKIINNWLKERENVEESDYDVRMCNAEDALFKIFEKINKPKNKKQMYCNFLQKMVLKFLCVHLVQNLKLNSILG